MNSEVIAALKEAVLSLGVNKIDIPDLEISIAIPPTSDMGDLACNISFRLAKELKQSPFEIAKRISVYLEKNNLTKLGQFSKIEAVAPGYVNFYFEKIIFTKKTMNRVRKEENLFGSSEKGQKRKVIIEHTAANPCKPLHIGHLRNAILGDIMGRIYRFVGWRVEIQNLIDDLGRQVTTLVWGLENRYHEKIPRLFTEKLDLWFGRVYSLSANALKEDNKLEPQVDSLMANAKTDDSIYSFIRIVTEKCVESNLETLWRMGITYDALIWESDISRSGVWNDTFDKLSQNPNFGFVDEGDKKGCFIVRLKEIPEFAKEKDPDKILIRSNGVPTYNAHDIALQMWKFGLSKASLQFKMWCTQYNDQILWSSTPFLGHPLETIGNADRVINVIGYEQNYLQKVLRTTFKLLGLQDKFDNSIHLSYKHVRLPGERFSGRTGNWFETRAWADAVVEDVQHIALEYLQEKRSDLDRDKQMLISEAIAIGTIRYWLTKFNTEQTIIFDQEKATQLEGDAGPFIMYSFVRGNKILQKAHEQKIKLPSTLVSPQVEYICDDTFKLIKLIHKFPSLVESVSTEFQLNLLTAYVYSLATQFNRFYSQCPVLKSKNKLRLFRLQLVQVFIRVLGNAMTLLGIPLIDEM